MKNMRSSFAVAGLATLMMWPGCFCCFVRGTKILTPRGPRRIEELAVGDEVISLDIESRKPIVRPIARTLRAYATEIFHLAAGELQIAGVTTEHPFYDAVQGKWTEAGALTKGTRLLAWLGSADVREIELTDVRRLPSAERVEIFNITIDGPEHNYFAEGLLVHNKEPPMPPPEPPQDLDGDGYFGESFLGSGSNVDCDDSDPTVNPGAQENCSDGKDNDCDGWDESKDPNCGADPCPLPTGVFAMESIFFGETDRDGALNLQNGWRQYGQDVDWRQTVDDSSRSCNPVAGGDVVMDADAGRDNSFGQHILPILREYFPDKPDMLTVAANEMIDTGKLTYLFDIAKIDVVNCSDVTSEIHRSAAMSEPPVFGQPDVWPIDPASLMDPTDPSLGANVTGYGQASNTYYRSQAKGILEVMIDINGAAFILPIHDPYVTMDFAGSGALGLNGQLGGIIDSNALVDIVAKFAATVEPTLCDPNSAAYQELKFRIRAISDSYYGPKSPGTKDCNGVTIGIGFTMRRAQLGDVAPPLPPPADVCSP